LIELLPQNGLTITALGEAIQSEEKINLILNFKEQLKNFQIRVFIQTNKNSFLKI